LLSNLIIKALLHILS